VITKKIFAPPGISAAILNKYSDPTLRRRLNLLSREKKISPEYKFGPRGIAVEQKRKNLIYRGRQHPRPLELKKHDQY
jgi:hypothetical protein